MCGIFGIIANEKSKLTKSQTDEMVNRLFVLSEARGKESAGIAIKNSALNTISVFKKSIAASKLIATEEYNEYYRKSFDGLFNEQHVLTHSFALIAHARLVTNGTQENNNNNQPCIKDGAIAVHNGIITNVDELWLKYSNLNRIYEVDTEVLLSIIRDNLNRSKDLIKSIQKGFEEIEGTASIAVLQNDSNNVFIATNNGSLYYASNVDRNIVLFASEKYILETLIHDLNLNRIGISEVLWLEPGRAIASDIKTMNWDKFILQSTDSTLSCETELNKDQVINYSPDHDIDIKKILGAKFHFNKDDLKRSKLQFNLEAITKLNRCSKCLLPETFPFIFFDTRGVCSYCNSYVPKMKGDKEDEFKAMMEKFRGQGSKPDCIVPFSGGRDSSYGLHYIVHELKMKPITYTYDWGMVTDLARRNIARVCGKLGIENIIVSADIHMKRRNIHKNVNAWLKKPDLGMIPLFMAGDKQFLHYVNVLKKQTGITLNIWSTNSLETTDFKVGFCGISPSFDKSRPDYLPFDKKAKLTSYYLKNFLTNPSYINSSLIDTIGSFYSYYAAPRLHYYQLFDWMIWDEKKIENTLFDEYNWEVSPDTTSTWRIGDGTAAFYNYIYYTVAGFSEFDTFRSNQIREGLITREQGLEFIKSENQPRFESMKWYLETINVDFERAISIVNKIPKLY
jgi:glucosamine--fructose-6-phosphate aminotransferase (isomerizing)